MEQQEIRHAKYQEMTQHWRGWPDLQHKVKTKLCTAKNHRTNEMMGSEITWWTRNLRVSAPFEVLSQKDHPNTGHISETKFSAMRLTSMK